MCEESGRQIEGISLVSAFRCNRTEITELRSCLSRELSQLRTINHDTVLRSVLATGNGRICCCDKEYSLFLKMFFEFKDKYICNIYIRSNEIHNVAVLIVY